MQQQQSAMFAQTQKKQVVPAIQQNEMFAQQQTQQQRKVENPVKLSATHIKMSPDFLMKILSSGARLPTGMVENLNVNTADNTVELTRPSLWSTL